MGDECEKEVLLITLSSIVRIIPPDMLDDLGSGPLSADSK